MFAQQVLSLNCQAETMCESSAKRSLFEYVTENTCDATFLFSSCKLKQLQKTIFLSFFHFNAIFSCKKRLFYIPSSCPPDAKPKPKKENASSIKDRYANSQGERTTVGVGRAGMFGPDPLWERCFGCFLFYKLIALRATAGNLDINPSLNAFNCGFSLDPLCCFVFNSINPILKTYRTKFLAGKI